MNKENYDYLLSDNLQMFQALKQILYISGNMDCLDGENLVSAIEIQRLCRDAMKGAAQ